MKLRGAWGHEAPALAQVHAAAFDHAWSAAEIAQLLDGPGGFALLVETDTPLAFILCRAVAGEAEIPPPAAAAWLAPWSRPPPAPRAWPGPTSCSWRSRTTTCRPWASMKRPASNGPDCAAATMIAALPGAQMPLLCVSTLAARPSRPILAAS